MEQLGSGHNGSVYYHKEKALVYKVIKKDAEYGGDNGSPFRHERVEPRIQQLLTTECAEATPHILPVVSFTNNPMSSKTFGVLATPLAEHSTAHRFSVDSDETFLRLYFQIVWTLYAINERFPGFKHNDLNADNVFITETKETRKYSAPLLGMSFKLPPGLSAQIADFEMASIPGVFENYKQLEFQLSNPCFSMGTPVDLYRVTVCFLGKHSDAVSDALANHINFIFKDTLRMANRENYFYPTAQIRAALGDVTPQYLLFNTLLFHQFRDASLSGIDKEFTVVYPSHMNSDYPLSTEYTEPLEVPLLVASMYTPACRYLSRLDKHYTTNNTAKPGNDLGGISTVVQQFVVGTTKAHRLRIAKRAYGLFLAFIQHPQSLAEHYPSFYPLLYICAVATAAADVAPTKPNHNTYQMYSAADLCALYDKGKYTANQLLQTMMQWNWLQQRQ